jgi:death on curing protein
MIAISEVILIQDILIEKFGGSRGIRDRGLLESALSRPFQTFDTNDLYSTATQKAAALIESIVTNHPFIDGNKRIGYVLMRLFLLENGLDLRAKQEEKYEFVIKIASGKTDFEDICNWIDKHLLKSNWH